MAFHASLNRALARPIRLRKVAIWVSTQSAVCCRVPRSVICASTSSWPIRARKSLMISTVEALTSVPVSGL